MERLIQVILARGIVMSFFLVTIGGLSNALWDLGRIVSINQSIATPSIIEDEGLADRAPLLAFAKAYDFQRQHQLLDAIRLYGLALERSKDDQAEDIRYNLGTLYLEDAFKLWKSHGLNEYIRINTLLAASKDHLKEALRLNPLNQDARFNLELAYRITPPPKERPKNDFQGNKGSVFATIPAIPGGGP